MEEKKQQFQPEPLQLVLLQQQEMIDRLISQNDRLIDGLIDLLKTKAIEPKKPNFTNPFEGISPEDKKMIGTLISSMPDILDQKAKMDKELEREKEEWKQKIK